MVDYAFFSNYPVLLHCSVKSRFLRIMTGQLSIQNVTSLKDKKWWHWLCIAGWVCLSVIWLWVFSVLWKEWQKVLQETYLWSPTSLSAVFIRQTVGGRDSDRQSLHLLSISLVFYHFCNLLFSSLFHSQFYICVLHFSTSCKYFSLYFACPLFYLEIFAVFCHHICLNYQNKK